MPRSNKRTRSRRRVPEMGNADSRKIDFRSLRHPFSPQEIFSEEYVATIHGEALKVLEKLGIKILLPEARKIFKAGGAAVDDSSEMVRIGSDIVAAAISSAPKDIELKGGSEARNLDFRPGNLFFMAGAGCPNVTDMERGRRPGSLND